MTNKLWHNIKKVLLLVSSVKEPLVLLRVFATIFVILALFNVYVAGNSWIEFQRTSLPVSKFFSGLSAVKAFLCATVGLLLYLPWRPLAWILGRHPFHFANVLSIPLLVFSAGAPILLHIVYQSQTGGKHE